MKTLGLFLALSLLYGSCLAQTSNDHDEFVYNRRLIKNSHSFIPNKGFVPDKKTAIAIAYAVAVPIYGKKQMDAEKPFRAELKDGIWTILGSLNCGSCVGGTLVMQIDKANGKIIFLTHTQ